MALCLRFSARKGHHVSSKVHLWSECATLQVVHAHLALITLAGRVRWRADVQ